MNLKQNFDDDLDHEIDKAFGPVCKMSLPGTWGSKLVNWFREDTGGTLNGRMAYLVPNTEQWDS